MMCHLQMRKMIRSSKTLVSMYKNTWHHNWKTTIQILITKNLINKSTLIVQVPFHFQSAAFTAGVISPQLDVE
jgi:hypothetical protein